MTIYNANTHCPYCTRPVVGLGEEHDGQVYHRSCVPEEEPADEGETMELDLT